MRRPDSFSEAALPLFDDTPVLKTGERLPSYIKDHRKRLRERFMDGGAAALPDYEMLELVLFRAIPRQDVKPLARRLIETFGDFNRVLSAPAPRLREVKGVGEAVVLELKLVEAAAHRLARAKVMKFTQGYMISTGAAVYSMFFSLLLHSAARGGVRKCI